MTKDILLRMKGLQFPEEGDEELLEVITPATYYHKNGIHYIKYDEVLDGFDGTNHNIIKIHPDCLEVTKKGVTNIHMVFQQNKKNISYYHTPFGNLLVGISATDIQVKAAEEAIDVKVSYALEINYEHLADRTICLNIQSQKEAHPFISSEKTYCRW